MQGPVAATEGEVARAGRALEDAEDDEEEEDDDLEPPE